MASPGLLKSLLSRTTLDVDPGSFAATRNVSPGLWPRIFPGTPGLSGAGSADATPASGTDKAPAAATVTNSFLIMFFPLGFCGFADKPIIASGVRVYDSIDYLFSAVRETSCPQINPGGVSQLGAWWNLCPPAQVAAKPSPALTACPLSPH